MSRIIAGRFDVTLDADAAIDALRREGFSRDEIDSFYVSPPGQHAMTPDVVHPVVRTHPYTGRKALYVFEGECAGIEGLPDDEALALVRDLQAHCLQERFLYRHRWRVGDVVMWDNCQSLHLAIADYRLPQRRLLHRLEHVPRD